MFKRVLVPTDFTDEADLVIEYVAGLREHGVEEVVLVHVVDIGRSTAWPVSPKIIEVIEEKLGDRQQRLSEAGFTVFPRILEGVPSTEVLRAAEDEECSLIVTGSHGKLPIEEMYFGSVSEAVTRHSEVPVLLLRYSILSDLGAAGKLKDYAEATFSKILFPTDFTEVSEAAMDELKELSEVGPGEVVTLHVVDTKRSETETENREQLDKCYIDCGRIAEQFRRREMRATTLCELGDPVEEILGAAEEEGATIIVMGSHGRGMVSEWLDGSVSLSVLRRGDRPLMVIRRAA